ncbi:MAG: twin-arginine translocase subunit TatC [Candidatus Poseidoniaceae archaeon]
MNDLHLSSDDRTTFQEHLDEMSRRITSIVILIVILTGIWSISIDEILRYTLSQLDPCVDECVNIFSPDEWAGTRWLSAAILGVFTAAPFAMTQAYGFAKPGLLPSEKRGMIIWMILMWIVSLSSLVFVLFRFLPWLYGYGHSFNDETGLVGRYDAAEMLRISISIAWAMILVLAAMSVVTIAGASKLLWSGNSGWWRLRIHGFMLMLLWLVIPPNLPGLLFSLTITASGLVEIIGWKSFRAPMPVGYGLKDILDVEGRIHRVLYVDCSCCGTTPSITPLEGMGILSYHSVCRDTEEQDHLIDVVKRFGASQIVFSGCMVESLPVNYLDSLRFLGCSVSTLNLSRLTTIRTDDNLVDCNLAMAWIKDPWSDTSAEKRCVAVIQTHDVSTIIYGEAVPFGLNLQPGEAWLTSPTDSLLNEIEKLGVNLTYSSN